MDLGCEWCDMISKIQCKQCRHGYFLYNSNCYTVCPNHYVADIFKRTCNPLDSTSIFFLISDTLAQVSYLKAFTIGTCKNLCGKRSVDCSCQPSCISQGNCCSDYHECEMLINKNVGRQPECFMGNPQCDLCENFDKIIDPIDPARIVPLKCGKCKEGLFLRDGQCFSGCVGNDIMMPNNFMCLRNDRCLVKNCSQCVEGNSSVCKLCMNGFYMYNNQCLEICPLRLRADRISWSCLEAPVFAWYWIFPSRSSCRGKCGTLVGSEMDCSCHQDCFRLGNCCQDIEDNCPQYVYWH